MNSKRRSAGVLIDESLEAVAAVQSRDQFHGAKGVREKAHATPDSPSTSITCG
jgi:hypothetical protein